MCTPRSIPTPEAGSEKPSGFVMPTAKPGDFPYFVRWWDCYALSGSLLSFKGKHLQSFLTYQESQELVVSCLRLSRRSKFLTDQLCQRATILFETASSWYPGEWVGVQTSDNYNKKSGGRRKQTVWRSRPISLPEVGTILEDLSSLFIALIISGMSRNSSGSPMNWCRKLFTEETLTQISKIF